MKHRETLEAFSKSKYWEVLRDEVLLPELADIENVRVELNTKLDINPEEAYIGKFLASESLNRIIESIDILNRVTPVKSIKDSLE